MRPRRPRPVETRWCPHCAKQQPVATVVLIEATGLMHLIQIAMGDAQPTSLIISCQVCEFPHEELPQ